MNATPLNATPCSRGGCSHIFYGHGTDTTPGGPCEECNCDSFVAPSVRIARRKIMRSRLATGPGPAWKWHYDVFRPDGSTVVYGTDRLSIASRQAREAAKAIGATVVRSWAG